MASPPANTVSEVRLSLDAAEADYDEHGGLSWAEVREQIAQMRSDEADPDDI